MFTGIVEEVGRVRSVGNGCIEIAAAKVTEGTAVGDSIAVNGVCLTVVAFTRDGFTADMMPVTLERTALGKLRAGDGVNLERALTLSSRLGGHIVSGHIDGVGRVKSVEAKDNARILRVEAASTILRYIVPRGSVALDGKQVGDSVNIENDVIGKYVEKLLRTPEESEAVPPGGLTMELLAKCGF